ncbi:MAG: 23S rRNA pseudouridine(955/2504/2580) synthase RluC [Alteromonadaceae bacterium]|nr:MAG: 23S rRNA pseudouridine(955/2504/2580) synthase RluC [Alteromonadaceae bacterium]
MSEKLSEKVRFVEILEDEAGQRLDNYLIRVLKGAPKSLVYRIIRKGEVRINKGRCKPDRKLQGGDVVRIPPVKLDSGKQAQKPGQKLMDLISESIIYESPALLIVNKPSGLAVHGGSGVQLGLIETLRQMYGEKVYLELVHRIDRDTSGCIMVAKKRPMLRYLHSLFRSEGGVNKTYLALVKGHWSKRKIAVDAPLKRYELQNGERRVRVDSDGKPSKTLFSVVERYDGATLVKAKPVTGRTHQIRVHGLHAGHPLVGDEKYGDDDFNREMKKNGLNRLFLHAFQLDLTLSDGTPLHVEAPLPTILTEGLSKLTRSE